MEAYRDQYATLFNNGRDVIVLGISTDPDTALVSWLAESDFPVMVMSDEGGKVGQTYQAYSEATKSNSRHLYVLDRNGRVTYKAIPFRILAADAYTELDAEIDKLAPPKKEGAP